MVTKEVSRYESIVSSRKELYKARTIWSSLNFRCLELPILNMHTPTLFSNSSR